MIRKRQDNHMVINLFFTLLITYSITIVGILILSLCLLLFRLTMVQVEYYLLCLYLFSAFMGGIWVGKRSKDGGLLWGTLSGGIYYAGFILISYLQKERNDESFFQKVGILLLVMVIGGIGSFLEKKIRYIRQEKSFMLYCSNATMENRMKKGKTK